MKKTIKLLGNDVQYNLKKNRRSKCVRIIIRDDGGFTVTMPRWVSGRFVEKFIADKSAWILDSLEKSKKSAEQTLTDRENSSKEYLKYKDNARILAWKRLEHFNKIYGFKFGKVSVKNQKTRWGSCSRKGNLNFNYKIAILPAELSDYIIVHELCHLGEFNHSKKFWNLVAKTVPNYSELRKNLRGKKLY